jgi:hypothetical protein
MLATKCLNVASAASRILPSSSSARSSNFTAYRHKPTRRSDLAAYRGHKTIEHLFQEQPLSCRVILPATAVTPKAVETYRSFSRCSCVKYSTAASA